MKKTIFTASIVGMLVILLCAFANAASDVTAKSWTGTRGWNGWYYSNSSQIPALTAPSSLTANASGSTITLGWSDNSSGAAQTLVQRSPNGSSGWSDIVTVSAGTTSYQDSGLADATYYYRTYAVYGAQQSASSSNTSNATVNTSGSTAITSITGSVTDGATVTVNGSGFGTMGGDVIGYIRGDEAADGAAAHGVTATVGTIDTYLIGVGDDTGGDHMLFATAGANGNKARGLRRLQTGRNTGNTARGGAGFTGFNTTKYFMSFWARNSNYTWPSPNSNNYKRFYSFGNGTSDLPQTMLFVPASQNSVGFYNNNPYSSDASSVRNMINTEGWVGADDDNTWHNWAIYTDFANTPTTRNGVLRVWRNQELGISSDTWAGRGPGVTDTTYTRQMYLGYYDQNMTGVISDFRDFYFASTRARIEVCDASTYTASTHCEIQLAREANWANTAVTGVVLNRGSFSSLTGTYMYMILSSGATLTNTGFAL